MSRRSAVIACLLAMGIFAMLSGCGGKATDSPPRGATAVIRGVTLETLREEPIIDRIEAVGTIKARNSAVIAARIAGTVTRLLVREGDRVPRGGPLLTIEAAESSAAAAGAQAGVEETRRSVDEARARKRLADATFERYRNLFQEQAVTRQEFEGREMEKEVAGQGVARAEARLAQAREGARAAVTVAGYSRVAAPLSGIVTSKAAEVGMTVFPGTQLLTLEEEGHYRLEAAFPESLMGKAKPGDDIRVAIDGIGDLNGKVAEVVPAADPASRTITVKIDVNAKGLRSGIFGRAYFPGPSRQGLLVPKSAVVERGALTSVWVVGKDNVVGMRLVKAGQLVAGRVEILSGLSAGERIVVSGVEKVVDGARVE
jgi:multidrug efflux system membrane fusion protein